MQFERTFDENETAPSIDEVIFGRDMEDQSHQYYGHVLYKFFGWFYNIKSIYYLQTIMNLVMGILSIVTVQQGNSTSLMGALGLIAFREYQSSLNVKSLTVLCPTPYRHRQTLLIGLDVLLFLYNELILSKVAKTFYSLSISFTVLSSHLVLYMAAKKYTERLSKFIGSSRTFRCLHYTVDKLECNDCLCMVCLETYDNRRVFTLVCGHLLHEQCLLTMFERSLNFCPMCKLKFS